jgi:hypothetical protein
MENGPTTSPSANFPGKIGKFSEKWKVVNLEFREGKNTTPLNETPDTLPNPEKSHLWRYHL